MDASIDAELVLTTWLAQKLAVATCTELEAAFSTPRIRVLGISGADQNYKLDAAVIDVDCFHNDFPSVSLLARQAHASIYKDLRGQVVAGAIATKVRTVVRPRWLAWANTNISHFSASYQIWLCTA